jgi:broad specificity phosphatase PhoE
VTCSDSIPRVWFVRHGESTWNHLGLIQGQDDTSRLTEIGRRQAQQAAELLAAQAINVQAVWSSDLERARQTATVIAQHINREITVDSGLRERSFGTWEGQPLALLSPSVTGIADGAIVDPSAHPAGGESLDELYERTQAVIGRIRATRPDGDVVVVAHGGSIRTSLAYCQGRPLTGLPWATVTNASVWTESLDPLLLPSVDSRTNGGML